MGSGVSVTAIWSDAEPMIRTKSEGARIHQGGVFGPLTGYDITPVTPPDHSNSS